MTGFPTGVDKLDEKIGGCQGQLDVIDPLREENRVLREQLGERPPRFTDDRTAARHHAVLSTAAIVRVPLPPPADQAVLFLLRRRGCSGTRSTSRDLASRCRAARMAACNSRSGVCHLLTACGRASPGT
jgi:hypothetical protein